MEKGQHLQFPATVKRTNRGLHVGFVPIPAKAFVEPFVHETLANHANLERTEVFYPWEKLAAYHSVTVGAKPAGIIMHAARVGSTLQIACLRCSKGLTAYSEPTVINDLLHGLLIPAQTRAWRAEMVAALRFIVDLIGQHASGPFVLKLRSWNSLFAPLISDAFPMTPWAFAVRSPVEVGVSIERKPPTWMRTFTDADNPFLPFAAAHGDPRSHETYFAGMFASFCDAIGDIDKRLGRLIRYEDLPNAVWESVCPHFGILLDVNEINLMKSVALYDAKLGGLFVPDAQPKQAAASAALRGAASQIAEPALRRLEAKFLEETAPRTDYEQHYCLSHQT
ncbi:MAG: hypothetical protein AAB370_11075 [Verrucomicrobiota bacterium]